MTAQAFKAIIKLRTSNGKVVQYPVSASDVNNESYEWQDGSGSLQIPLRYGDVELIDVLQSGSGNDTSQADVVINNKNTGVVVMNAGNQATTIGRQFEGAGITILQGSKLDFVQKT